MSLERILLPKQQRGSLEAGSESRPRHVVSEDKAAPHARRFSSSILLERRKLDEEQENVGSRRPIYSASSTNSVSRSSLLRNEERGQRARAAGAPLFGAEKDMRHGHGNSNSSRRTHSLSSSNRPRLTVSGTESLNQMNFVSVTTPTRAAQTRESRDKKFEESMRKLLSHWNKENPSASTTASTGRTSRARSASVSGIYHRRHKDENEHDNSNNISNESPVTASRASSQSARISARRTMLMKHTSAPSASSRVRGPQNSEESDECSPFAAAEGSSDKGSVYDAEEMSEVYKEEMSEVYEVGKSEIYHDAVKKGPGVFIGADVRNERKSTDVRNDDLRVGPAQIGRKRAGRGDDLPPKTAAEGEHGRTTLRQKHPHTASVRDVVVDVVDRIGAVLRQSKMSSSSSRKSFTEPMKGCRESTQQKNLLSLGNEDQKGLHRTNGDEHRVSFEHESGGNHRPSHRNFARTCTSGFARCRPSHGSSTCLDPIGRTESSGILGSPLMREDKYELLHSTDMADMCNETRDDDTTELVVAKVGDLIDILHWDRLKGSLSIRIRAASPSFGGEVPYETTVPDVALQLEGEIARGLIHEPDGYYYPPHDDSTGPTGGMLGGSSFPSNHNKNYYISAAPFNSLVRILDEVGEFYEVDLGSTTRRGLILKTAVQIAGEPALNDTAQMKRLRRIEAAPLTSQIQPNRCSRRNVQSPAGAQTGSPPRSSAVSSWLLRTLVFPLLRLCGLSSSSSPLRKRIKRDLGKGRDSIPAFGRFASNGRAHRSWAFGGLGYYMQLVTSVPAIVLGITGACLAPNGGTNSSSSSRTVAGEWDQECFVANILAACCGALFLLTHVETSLLSAFTCARRTKCGGPRSSLVRALFVLILSAPLYLSTLTIIPAVGYTMSGIFFFISSCCGEVGEISGVLRRVHMEYWKLTHHYEEKEEDEEEDDDDDDVVKSDVIAASSWYEKEDNGTKNSSAIESRTNPETDVEAPMDSLKTTLIRSDDDGDDDDDVRKSMGSGTHWSWFKIWIDRHRLRSTFPSSLICVCIWLLINSVLFLTKYEQEISPTNRDGHHPDQGKDEMHQVSGFTACARGLSNVLIFNLILALFLICPTVLRKLNRLALGDGICAFFFSWIPLNGKTAVWHKRVGSIIFIFSMAHMWSHIMAHMQQARTRHTDLDAIDLDDDAYSAFTNKSTSGALAMIALCLICAGAQAHVRRTMHSLFLFTHIGGMAILLLALVFHIPKSCLLLLSPPLFLYLYDMRQRSTRHDKACVKLLEVTYAQCMLELTFAAPWRYRAGQYVWLHCPLVSKYEWHPFSLSSSSESEVLRVNMNIWPGGWTEGVRDFLAELIQESEKRDLVMREKKADNINANGHGHADGQGAHRSSATKVCDRTAESQVQAADRFRFETRDWLTGSTTNHIGRASWDSVPLFLFDGPHPAPMMHYPKFETIVLIGAGIGVTPMNAVLEQLIEHVWVTEEESEIETRHAYAVWLCPYRDVNSHRWFAQRLSNFDTTVYDHHSRLAQTPTFHYEMHTFVTSTNPKSEASGSRDMFPQVPIPEPVIMDSFHKDRRPIVKRFSDDHLIDAMLSPATPSSQFQALMSVEEHQRDNALGHVHVWNERPFWGDIFSRIRARHSRREKHRVGVFYAGAPQIGLHLQRCARKFSDNTITFRVF